MSGEVMIGFVEVLGARHYVKRASEDPNCPDGEKGRLYAACSSSLRVFLDPTTHRATCKRCLNPASTQHPGDQEGTE